MHHREISQPAVKYGARKSQLGYVGRRPSILAFNAQPQYQVPNNVSVHKQFINVAIVFQVIIIAIYFFKVDYASKAKDSSSSYDGSISITMVDHYYSLFTGIHIMMYIGFGYLMTFVKTYGFGAIGLNFLISAFGLQWAILTNAACDMIINKGTFSDTIQVGITNFITGDFAVAAVLISFGAVLGKTTPAQLLVMTFFECIFYSLNQTIFYGKLQAVDIGGSVSIHTFGAYFGLALSWIICRNVKDDKGEFVNHPKRGSSYRSDLFSMVGTIFLFVYWPNFNSVMTTEGQQHRIIINTILALTSSCFFAFVTDAIMRENNKFNIETIQNATLAGGVAIGGSSDFMLTPGGALIIGGLAGIISTIGFIKIQTIFRGLLGLDDSCGVHNLHGMPGLLGAFAGIVGSFFATESTYGKSIGVVFPARASSNATVAIMMGVIPGSDRNATNQMIYQIYGLLMTLGFAIVGGSITGLIVKSPWLLPSGSINSAWGDIGESLKHTLWFDDNLSWSVEMPPEEKIAIVNVNDDDDNKNNTDENIIATDKEPGFYVPLNGEDAFS